ncbi:MAG: MoaD/ThiS family protein [Verrucomicrobiota bacterium]
MQIPVHFYSYFKELTGCAETREEISHPTTIENLFHLLSKKFPKLTEMKKSTLVAVGVDYQTWDYVLREGDEVSLFPPVQGG